MRPSHPNPRHMSKRKPSSGVHLKFRVTDFEFTFIPWNSRWKKSGVARLVIITAVAALVVAAILQTRLGSLMVKTVLPVCSVTLDVSHILIDSIKFLASK